MKKLIPLFLILLIMAGALYFQDEILDRFMGPSSSSDSAPPGLPSLNIGATSTDSNDSLIELEENDVEPEEPTTDSAPPGLPSLNLGPPSVEPEPILEPDLSIDNVLPEQDEDSDELGVDDLFFGDEQSDEDETQDEPASASIPTAAPPGLPALSFGTAPQEPTSDEAPSLDGSDQSLVQIPVPEISNQEFKNSFIKFAYPQNISIQNVSLSSIDLNSIETKMMNISYFNNENSVSVREFVKDSSSVTDFFAEDEPVELQIEGVDEVFVANDLISQTKFYLVSKDNLFVLIEMDIESNYKFLEDILIPSIESQII